MGSFRLLRTFCYGLRKMGQLGENRSVAESVKRQLIHPGVRQTIHPLGILSYVHHISLDPIVKMVFSVG